MPTSLSKYLDPTGLDETVVNIRQLTEALEAEMQELPYARPDGLYPDMTVGAVIGADETAQWAQRVTTGSGAATLRSVQGAAVGWNQKVVNGNFESASYWTGRESTIAVVDGVATVTPNSEGTYKGLIQTATLQTETMIVGHKYYIGVTCKSSAVANLQLSCSGVSGTAFANLPANQWKRCTGFWTTSVETEGRLYALITSTLTTADTVQFKDAILVDLTQMFGSGNEPSTVAEFEHMFPEAYYPYSAPTLKAVQISGIRSTDAQGGELDSVEWTAQTIRAAGSVADVLYSDHVDVRVGVYTFTGTETLQIDNWQPTEDTYAIGFSLAMIDAKWPTSTGVISNVRMAELETIEYGDMYSGTKTGLCLAPKPQASAYSLFVRVPKTLAADKNTLMAWLAGKTIFYELATPTTQPISPALPMSYKVQQGGMESIIVPDGEVSAAPVLTVAEPVNMSTELARIWAAIEQLQSHGTAQLSRADAASIEEVQKDTAEIAEIDTTKEVTE